MQKGTSPTSPREAALALLRLPDVNVLTEQQRRGQICVWDGAPLAPENAVDLGPRTAEDGRRWFPQGCTICVASKAYAALFDHAISCLDGCADDPGGCAIGKALIKLEKEGREWVRRGI
jgi:hypothetical protein